MENNRLVMEFGEDCVAELSRYRALAEEGKLYEFPCAIGDTLYVVTSDSETGIEKTKCTGIHVYSAKKIVIYAECQNDSWGQAKWKFKAGSFGHKVFLEEEAASLELVRRRALHLSY